MNGIEIFLEDMQSTFGKYRDGMSFSIKQKLYGLNQANLDSLSEKLTAEYDMGRPPSLKVILSTMFNHGISGDIPKYYSCSVCETCGKDFSVNSLVCPHCKELRTYGVIKILQNPPPWHDAEIKQQKKDQLEIDDRIRKLDAK